RRLIGRGREDDPAAVAVLLRARSSFRVLLVDEVRTQARVVVRPLSLGFCRAAGMLGAALYAGTVVLVLDPDALGGEPRAGSARAGDHSIQIL
ncbi:MAG TPA: chemotaxis protein CheW, partial [Polyangiales bacterium]